MLTVVIGLGVSGLSAAHFLQTLGKNVLGVDKHPDSALPFPVFNEKEALPWNKVDLVIFSPGISREHPHFVEAKRRGIEVIDEMELGLRHLEGKAVGITGTNGKTTVALLTEHVLCRLGFNAKAVGNVGVPLTQELGKKDLYVIEFSSYQLESCSSKVLESGVILNITPDHLDRYPSFEAYAQAKLQLKKCIKPTGSLFIYEKISAEFSHLLKGMEYLSYSLELLDTNRELSSIDQLNARASFLLCHSFGVTKELFLEAYASFKKPSHRVEFVLEENGVFYFDDSKGTNVDAVIHAVEAMKGPVILIAGGVDKGSSYLPWIEGFQGKVKKIIAIGAAASKIDLELKKVFDVTIETSLERAVCLARECALKGDCVLLSPACSSFDMFIDYAHRGREFQRLVTQEKERR